jgi:hypothetical protein
MTPKVRRSFVGVGAVFSLAGIYAVFTTMNGAGSLGLFLAGAAFVALGFIGRIPTSVKVGGAEVSLGDRVLDELASLAVSEDASSETREVAETILKNASAKLTISRTPQPYSLAAFEAGAAARAAVEQVVQRIRAGTMFASWVCPATDCKQIVAGVLPQPWCPDHQLRMIRQAPDDSST